MALSEIYVDPSLAADSGAGTIGDPYGDLEYAIEQTTFDTTNGTRINIKAGTDEVLAADLETALADTVTSVAWVPTETAQLVIEGYTSAAGDGGEGGISGGGSVSILNTSRDYINLVNLHLHNTGSNIIVDLDNFSSVINCRFDNTTGAGLSINVGAYVGGCHFTNIGGVGLSVNEALVEFCSFVNGTNDFSTCLTNSGISVMQRNIIDVDGTTVGISLGDWGSACHNTVYSAGGSGFGINGLNGSYINSINNNLIEGFSDTGGIGIDLDGTNVGVRLYGANSVYNCATATTTPTLGPIVSLGGNETLSASPFTDAANQDFSPVNTGSVKEGSLPAAFGNGQI